MKTLGTTLLTLALLLGSTALAGAATKGTVTALHPPGGGTAHGVAFVQDGDGNSYRVRTPLESGLPLEIGDELQFDLLRGGSAGNATLVFGEPDSCFLPALEARVTAMRCDISGDAELSDETKLKIRNAARSLGNDGGSVTEIRITKG